MFAQPRGFEVRIVAAVLTDKEIGELEQIDLSQRDTEANLLAAVPIRAAG